MLSSSHDGGGSSARSAMLSSGSTGRSPLPATASSLGADLSSAMGSGGTEAPAVALALPVVLGDDGDAASGGEVFVRDGLQLAVEVGQPGRFLVISIGSDPERATV